MAPEVGEAIAHLAHFFKEILSLVSDNNAFCIVTDNNPLIEEDKAKLLALIQANKNRDRAESRSKGARDILGSYRLPLEAPPITYYFHLTWMRTCRRDTRQF